MQVENTFEDCFFHDHSGLSLVASSGSMIEAAPCNDEKMCCFHSIIGEGLIECDKVFFSIMTPLN